MLENIRGHSRGSIPPLRMPSPLPHDLCHEWNVSRRLPAIYVYEILSIESYCKNVIMDMYSYYLDLLNTRNQLLV